MNEIKRLNCNQHTVCHNLYETGKITTGLEPLIGKRHLDLVWMILVTLINSARSACEGTASKVCRV